MQNELGKLSVMELEVMRVIWGMAAPVTVSRVLGIFAPQRGWKTSTLSTIMDRLIGKGYLTKTIQGKANIYTPMLTEEAHKENETKQFLSSVHKGSVKSFIAALTGCCDMSAEDIAEIGAWLREKAGDS